MFNVLEIKSSTLSLFRCKGCLSIIFRQDSISQFISYDSQDFGHLSQFSSKPALEGEANYFVLEPQMTYYSSMKVDYGNFLTTNYHPFFMMNLFEVQCSYCNFTLGYEVETVNQNTIWMQGRLLIDVQKCAILKDAKDQMSKLIKALKVRLSMKLGSLSQRSIAKQSKINKESQVIRRFEKISIKNKRIHTQRSDYSKKDNSKLKKRMQSLQTTNPTMNLISKGDTLPMQNSNLISHVFKNEEISHPGRSLEPKPIPALQVRTKSENKAQPKDKSKKNNDQDKFCQSQFVQIEMTEEERDQIKLNMHEMKEKLLRDSSDLQARSIIVKIFNSLTKTSAQEKYVYKKIPTQSLALTNLVTCIRKRYIEDLKPKK